MQINNLACTLSADRRVISADVVWEDNDFATQELFFEIVAPPGELTASDRPIGLPSAGDNSSADAFLSACFPLAAVHRERRIRLAGRTCPMLNEGLRTVHAWWRSWGGMPEIAPRIENAASGSASVPAAGARTALGYLSGGVDGLHMLMCNRRRYDENDPAYIRDVLFIHGYDIGKRARDPEDARYQMVLRRLAPVAAETGVRIVACRTNLRHLPSRLGFWEQRHSGPALIAVGHAALQHEGFLSLGASYPVDRLVPWGSHPALDGLLSSQRVTVIHEGARFTRLEKVRELAAWPTAINALRVCSAGTSLAANCGRCEKCLRTRLELLAAGIEETEAFGPSLTPLELWEEEAAEDFGDRAIFYEDLLPFLSAPQYAALHRLLAQRVALYRAERGEPAPLTISSLKPGRDISYAMHG
jgi:hypothetical protein